MIVEVKIQEGTSMIYFEVICASAVRGDAMFIDFGDRLPDLPIGTIFAQVATSPSVGRESINLQKRTLKLYEQFRLGHDFPALDCLTAFSKYLCLNGYNPEEAYYWTTRLPFLFASKKSGITVKKFDD